MKKITIIEDNDDLRNLMRLPLQAAGYEVATHRDGSTLDEPSQAKSQLYFIDLDLGGVSGLDLCKLLKSKKDNEGTPFIIIVSANPDVRELAMEACADDTLSKPFTSKELLEKTQLYIRVATPALKLDTHESI